MTTQLDMTPQSVGERQSRLVQILFDQHATLSRAWRAVYGATGHHVSLAKLLSSPTVRDHIRWRLERGDRLNHRLHDKVVAMLAPKNELDVYELEELF